MIKSAQSVLNLFVYKNKFDNTIFHQIKLAGHIDHGHNDFGHEWMTPIYRPTPTYMSY